MCIRKTSKISNRRIYIIQINRWKKTYLLYYACRTRTEWLINSFFFFISSRMPISNTFLLLEKKTCMHHSILLTTNNTPAYYEEKCLAVSLMYSVLTWLTVMAPGKLVYWLVTYLHHFNHSLKQIRSR